MATDQVIQMTSSSRNPSRARNRARGFTLIELMVVVAVVAILAAVAVPSYQDAVRKGHRGQAKADLVDLAQQAERYRTINNGSYLGFTVPSGAATSPRTGTARYDVALQGAATATTFEIRAVPRTGQNKDTKCMTLSINQLGQKAIVGGSGSATDCW